VGCAALALLLLLVLLLLLRFFFAQQSAACFACIWLSTCICTTPPLLLTMFDRPLTMFDRFPAGVLPGAVDYYITGPLQRRRAAAITKVRHRQQHTSTISTDV
jgi:hypothetical protein